MSYVSSSEVNSYSLDQPNSVNVGLIIGSIVAVIIFLISAVLVVYYKLRHRMNLDKLPPDVAIHYKQFFDSRKGAEHFRSKKFMYQDGKATVAEVVCITRR